MDVGSRLTEVYRSIFAVLHFCSCGHSLQRRRQRRRRTQQQQRREKEREREAGAAVAAEVRSVLLIKADDRRERKPVLRWSTLSLASLAPRPPPHHPPDYAQSA